MSYLGHHPDGSSVQLHSAGPLYPFVLQQRYIPTGGVHWEVIGPGIDGALRFPAFAMAQAGARRLLAVRDNADAWAFELEALQQCALQRIAPMQAAALHLGGPREWAAMSKVDRVRNLLRLGAVRNVLKLPMAQRPVFAELAACTV